MTEREIFFKHLGIPAANPSALKITKAKGIYLWDNKNNKIIDLCAGVAVSNIGHNHPNVINAVKKQLDKHMHIHVYGELIITPQVQYAKLITEQLPKKLNTIYLVNSGSEANEGAIKIAKRYTGKYEIISFKNAYHGSTGGALSILGNEYFKKAYRPLMPAIKFIEFNNEKTLNKITEKTAAVIVEPVQAEAGVIIPQNKFLTKLREKCNKTKTLLIFDEVQTGFGRTGKLFAFQKYNVTPDIITIAKAMGGGMPIGGFITSNKIMSSLQTNPTLGHITTFGGHPISAAAAIANLKTIINEKIIEKVEKKGKLFEKNLTNPKIKSTSRVGLLMAIELKNTQTTTKFIQKAEKNGIITDAFLFAQNKFRIGPPLTITEKQIIQTCKIINNTLNEI